MNIKLVYDRTLCCKQGHKVWIDFPFRTMGALLNLLFGTHLVRVNYKLTQYKRHTVLYNLAVCH